MGPSLRRQGVKETPRLDGGWIQASTQFVVLTPQVTALTAVGGRKCAIRKVQVDDHHRNCRQFRYTAIWLYGLRSSMMKMEVHSV